MVSTSYSLGLIGCYNGMYRGVRLFWLLLNWCDVSQALASGKLFKFCFINLLVPLNFGLLNWGVSPMTTNVWKWLFSPDLNSFSLQTMFGLADRSLSSSMSFILNCTILYSCSSSKSWGFSEVIMLEVGWIIENENPGVFLNLFVLLMLIGFNLESLNALPCLEIKEGLLRSLARELLKVSSY